MNEQGARRLLKLCRRLEEVEREGLPFDMGVWALGPECGSTACAFGYACQMPEFIAAGLKLESWFNSSNSRAEQYPLYDGIHIGIDAAQVFFGLHADEAEHLFHIDAYDSITVTPADVRKRIVELVKDYHPELGATLDGH